MTDCNEGNEIQTRRNRKQRTIVNLENINTIKRLKAAKHSTKFISETLNLSYSTVTKIIQKICNCEENEISLETICKKTGPKPKQIDYAANVSLIEIVQDDPTLNQKGMQLKLRETGKNFSISKISRTLKRLSYTRKRIKKRSARTISVDVINQRKVYARDIRLYSNSRLIFLDESGFNLHTGTMYGYSQVNTDVHRVVPANRGRNISLIALLSCSKINNYKLIDGPYNTVKLVDFLEESWSCNSIVHNDIIIMDNVRFHHNSDVKNWCEGKNIKIKYLPPYSPDLNPIENVFGTIKSRYSTIRPFASTNTMLKEYVGRVIANMNDDPDITYEGYFQRMREYLTLAYNGDYF